MILLLCGDIETNPGPLHDTFSSDFSIGNSDSSSFFSKNKKSFISLMHLNVQSLRPKLRIIEATLNDFDILCFTESWLNPSINDKDVHLTGFELPFRHDRLDRPGGGVVVYCKDHLLAKRRGDLELAGTGIECVWIQFLLKNEKYLLGTFYRPPNSSVQTWHIIEQSFELAIDTKIKNIIITGDFNENQLSNNESKINNLTSNFNLFQIISEPTCVSESTSTLIDLLITNNPSNILYSAVCEPFLDVNTRYHRPIISLINSEKPKTTVTHRKIWLYQQGDFNKYRNKLESTDWDSIIDSSEDINEIAQKFTDKILDIASDSIPNRIISCRKNDLPWITNEIKKLIRKRNRLRKKAKKN